MFRKLQTRLSFFCIAVTASILIAMSFGALLISESGMRKNESVTFQNHVSTLLSYLRDQSTVSHTWAATAEQTNDIWLYIEENGTPLFFNTSNESRQRLDLYRGILCNASACFCPIIPEATMPTFNLFILIPFFSGIFAAAAGGRRLSFDYLPGLDHHRLC